MPHCLKYLKYAALAVLLTGYVQIGYAQTRELDSLKVLLLKTNLPDTTRLKEYFNLSWELCINNYYEESRTKANEGLEFFNKIFEEPSAIKDTFFTRRCYQAKAQLLYTIGVTYQKQGDVQKALHYDSASFKIFEYYHDKKGLASAYNQFGNCYLDRSDYEKSKEYYLLSLKVRIELNDKHGMGAAYTNIGNIYFYQGNYSEALKNYVASMKLKEENGDKRGVISCYNNICNVYEKTGDYDDALKNGEIALQLSKNMNDRGSIAASYNMLGLIYHHLGDNKKALANQQAALEIQQMLGMKLSIADSYNMIGAIQEDMGSHEEAMNNYTASLKIREEQGDKNGIAECAQNIGIVYLDKKQYAEALPWLNKALKVSREINNPFLVMGTSKSLYTAYGGLNDYKNALENYIVYAQIKDSVYSEESKKSIALIKTQYETEKKDNEIKLLNKDKLLSASEISKQKTARNYLIGAFALLVIFSLISLYFYNQRRKTQFNREVSEVEMKALRAQMNPHFIFNSLNSIHRYWQQNDDANASEYLIKFSKLMRLILENSRKPEVSLAEDLEALELYMQLEAARMNHKFSYEINISPEIDTENTLIPPLILQPFVENAIWHGLQHKEGDGKITIYLTRKGDMIECAVEDNGVGREKSGAINKKMNGAKKQSLGMEITGARIDIINKIKKAKAGVKLVDLPEGLRVEILLPMETSFE